MLPSTHRTLQHAHGHIRAHPTLTTSGLYARARLPIHARRVRVLLLAARAASGGSEARRVHIVHCGPVVASTVVTDSGLDSLDLFRRGLPNGEGRVRPRCGGRVCGWVDVEEGLVCLVEFPDPAGLVSFKR